MAIDFICGFETGSALELGGGAIVGTGSITSAIKRSGNYAFRSNPATTAVGYAKCFLQGATNSTGTTNTAGGNAYFGSNDLTTRFYIRIDTLPASGSENILHATGAIESQRKYELRVTSGGQLQMYDNSGAQVGSTGTTVLSTGVWHRIEVQHSGTTSASWAVRINGATEISGVAANFSNASMGLILLGKSYDRSGQTVDFYYDDVMVRSDLTWPGAGEGKLRRAISDGSSTTGWTGTYADVDEIPNDAATTVISAGAVGVVRTVLLETAATVGISGTINAVLSGAVMLSGSRLIGTRIISGATTSSTTATNISPSFAQLARIHPTDPSASAAWTEAALNACEAGVFTGLNPGTAQCTSIFQYVDYTPDAGDTEEDDGDFFLMF